VLKIQSKIALTKKTNSTKIRLLLTDHCISLKAEISRLDELELMEKSIRKDIDLFNIPKILPQEIKEMQAEVEKRKEYEFICDYYRKYFIDNILTKEEDRRKG
jgi:hypothetical protein